MFKQILIPREQAIIIIIIILDASLSHCIELRSKTLSLSLHRSSEFLIVSPDWVKTRSIQPCAYFLPLFSPQLDHRVEFDAV